MRVPVLQTAMTGPWTRGQRGHMHALTQNQHVQPGTASSPRWESCQRPSNRNSDCWARHLYLSMQLEVGRRDGAGLNPRVDFLIAVGGKNRSNDPWPCSPRKSICVLPRTADDLSRWKGSVSGSRCCLSRLVTSVQTIPHQDMLRHLDILIFCWCNAHLGYH